MGEGDLESSGRTSYFVLEISEKALVEAGGWLISVCSHVDITTVVGLPGVEYARVTGVGVLL